MMNFLLWSRLLFWTFVALLIIGAGLWVAIIERNDRHQQHLAEQHLRKRRTQRYKNLNN
jgi:cytochrome c-type biogenesis protein CcmH/NrfF